MTITANIYYNFIFITYFIFYPILLKVTLLFFNKVRLLLSKVYSKFLNSISFIQKYLKRGIN